MKFKKGDLVITLSGRKLMYDRMINLQEYHLIERDGKIIPENRTIMTAAGATYFI